MQENKILLFLSSRINNSGEVAEWSIAAVSKTVVRLPADRGFESPPLRKDKLFPRHRRGIFVLQNAESGLPE
jgi:hypothetical protein